MSESDKVDDLAKLLEPDARAADPELVSKLMAAARADQPDAALEQVAVAALEAGTSSPDVVMACSGARFVIRADAGSDRGFDDPAEDHVLDLIDRLTGWCHPDAHLLPRD